MYKLSDKEHNLTHKVKIISCFKSFWYYHHTHNILTRTKLTFGFSYHQLIAWKMNPTGEQDLDTWNSEHVNKTH